MLRIKLVGLRSVFGVAIVCSLATGADAQPNPTTAESFSYILPSLQRNLDSGAPILADMQAAAARACLDQAGKRALLTRVNNWRGRAARDLNEGRSEWRDSLRVRERAFWVANTREWRALYDLSGRIYDLLDVVHAKPVCPQQATPQGFFRQGFFYGIPPTAWTGPAVGVHGIVAPGTMRVDETFAATGVRTFHSEDSAVGGGGGIQFGYGFAPFNNNVIVTPFVSADFLHLDVQHEFSPNTFYGQRTNFIGTAGVDVGLAMPGRVQPFLRGGVAAVHQETTINFGGPVTNEKDWKAAALVGGGVAANITNALGLRNGTSVSLVFTYEHLFVEDTTLNRPAASPFFNYKFDRDVDVFKAGVRVNPSIFERDSILTY